MPFDSKGNFTRLHNWEQDRIDDIDIVTDHHDAEDDNFTQGLNECFLRNGLVAMKGNLDAGGFNLIGMADGVNDSDAVNKKQLQGVVTELYDNFLIGDIKCSALKKDHASWLICDGRAILRAEYDKLFEAIGTSFGVGDNATTFNLPDCRGVVVRGVDSGRGFDKDRKLGSYQQDGLPNILAEASPTIAGCRDKSVAQRAGAFTGSFTGNSYRLSDYPHGNPAVFAHMWYNTGNLNFDASKSNATYGRAAEARVKNIALNYFIKAKEK